MFLLTVICLKVIVRCIWTSSQARTRLNEVSYCFHACLRKNFDI